MITGINESKALKKHGRKCNSNQWWNNDERRCECKKRHICKKDHVWNPLICNCNKVKDIDIRNCIYYLSNHIISIRNFTPNNITIDERTYNKTLINYIEYMTIKDSKYIKTYSVSYLYVDGYSEEKMETNV